MDAVAKAFRAKGFGKWGCLVFHHEKITMPFSITLIFM